MPFRASLVGLAAATVAAPLALGATGLTYSGALKSDPARKVTVRTSAGYMTKFTASVPAMCGRTSLDLTVAFPPSHRKGARAKITKSKFATTFAVTSVGVNDRRTITGTIKGRTMTGLIRIRGLCNADEPYTARR